MNNDVSSNDDSDVDEEDIPSWLRVDEEDAVSHIVTPNEILYKGLEVVKYTEKMLGRCHRKTNLIRFNLT